MADLRAHPALVEMKGVTKHFGKARVNNNIDFSVNAGEIVGLLGENGAGKSTLMNVLFGFVRPDEADITVFGEPLSGHSPAEAIGAGINMVHQHFMLVPSLTVTENIVLGREPRAGPFLDMAEAQDSVRELIARYGFDIDATANVGDLSVGQRQRVEILRSLYRNAKVLVLDEPTAVLAPMEVARLFDILRGLARDGMGIVLIAHKLDEVLAVCDRVVVLRRGDKVGERLARETSARDLVRMMIGDDVKLERPAERPAAATGGPVLLAEKMSADGTGGDIHDVSLSVNAGEIVVIAGIDGNGQSTLENVLVGLTRLRSGRIVLAGSEISHASVAQRRKAGLGYVPQDRLHAGLLLNLSLVDNAILGRQRSPRFMRAGFLKMKAIIDGARAEMTRFDVRFRALSDKARSLSGGNQQKLVLGRAVSDQPRLLVASQVGRGLDVGAVAAVYRQLRHLRDHGAAILVISFDLDEVLELADRILVIRGGRIVTEMARDGADKNRIGAAMTSMEASPA